VNGVDVTGTVQAAADGLSATFDPDAALGSDAIHEVRLTSGISDSQANTLIPFTSFFRTEVVPDPDQPLPDVSDEAQPPPNATDARTGTAVSGAGNLDPDNPGDFTGCGGPGFQDTISGAPGYMVDTNAEAGAAIVYLGSTLTSERTSPDILFTGEAAHDRAGSSVAGGYDFHGDGIPDIVIGAEQVDRTQNPPVATGAGKVYLIYFDPSDTTHYPNLGDPNTSDTVSLSLVGQPGGIPGVVFVGEALGDQAGFSVSFGGLFGGGAGPDLVIGAPGKDTVAGNPPSSLTDAGTAYLVYDDPSLSGTINLSRVACDVDSTCGVDTPVGGYEFVGDQADEAAGYSVAFVGDVIGGAEDDVAIGAPFADVDVPVLDVVQADAGSSFVSPGGTTTNGIIEVCTIPETGGGSASHGDQAGEESGSSIGSGSVLIGSPRFDFSGSADAGRVLQATGRLQPNSSLFASDIGDPDGGNPSAIDGVIWAGAAAGDELGRSVGGLRDVTGNGFGDIGLGAPFADPNATLEAGIIYVVEGGVPAARRGTVQVTQIGQTVPGQQLFGTEAGENAGASVAAICDVDGDGDLDFAVGTPGRDAQTETDSGAVSLVLETEPSPPGLCGPGGCSVVHLETGAQLDVPSGSLGSDVTLDVTGVLDPILLPASAPAGDALLGAADFDPDGQTFGAPLPTGRVPVRSTYEGQLTDGEAFRLYRYDGMGWTDSGIDALVGANLQYPGRKALVADLDTLRYYAAFIPDLDGDGIRDSQDGDRDGDGIPNESDCAPDNPSNPPPPGEVGTLSASRGGGGSTLLEWPSVVDATMYDVARGSLADLQIDGDTSGAIGLSCDQPGTTYEDTEVPAVSAGYYYLTRAANECGKGSWGDGASGARNVIACP
jgi:hypothetical protein